VRILGCNFFGGPRYVPCVSRIVAFIVKNMDTKILNTCLVVLGQFFSCRNLNKNKAQTIKYSLSCVKSGVLTASARDCGLHAHLYL